MPNQSTPDLTAGGRAPGTTRAAGSALPRPRSEAAGNSCPGFRANAFGRRGRRLVAVAWLFGTPALGTLPVRVSLSVGMDSDAANKALQGWDLLHGNPLLHGWITGDATFYALEVPVSALVEACIGLSPLVTHVEAVTVYLLILALVSMLARGSAVGQLAALRAMVAAAILLVPLGSPYGISLLIEQPDHVGTSAFLLAAFALADRAGRADRTDHAARAVRAVQNGRSGSAARTVRSRPWVTMCALLLVCTAGILSDDTVTYVAIPAIAVVCALRIVSERRVSGKRWVIGEWRLRGNDAAVLFAALAAIPAEHYVRSLMHRSHGYWMTRPATEIAASSAWPTHLHRTVRALAALYGVTTGGSPWPVLIPIAALGACALTVAFAGFVRVLRRWRSREATRAEQMCAVAIALNLAVYTVSTTHTPIPAHEIAAVLPLSAVLGARGLSPAWTSSRHTATRAACAAVAVVALAPTAVSALRPTQPPIPTAPPPALSSFLDLHHLRHGIAGYWDASAITVDSGGAVTVRAVVRTGDSLAMYGWETRRDWYSPRLNDATFAVAYDAPTSFGLIDADRFSTADYESFLGKPAEVYRVDGRTVLVYPGNLLDHVASRLPPRDRRE